MSLASTVYFIFSRLHLLVYYAVLRRTLNFGFLILPLRMASSTQETM